MKRVLCVFATFLILFCLSACTKNKVVEEQTNKETTTEITLENFNEQVFLVNDTYELRKIYNSYPELRFVKDFSVNQNLFITEDGSLYYISYDKLCSNNKYYMKVETDIKFSKFLCTLKEELLLSNDNDLYTCVYTSSGWEVIKNEDAEKWLFKNNIIKSDFQNIMILPHLNDEKAFGRRIYYIRDSYLEHFSNQELNLLNVSPKTIEWFVDNTIKLNNKYYVFSNNQTNLEECSKYADVKPIYEQNFYEVSLPIDNVRFFKYIDYTNYAGDGYCVVVDSDGMLYISQ